MSHNPNDIFDPKRYGLITGSKCSVLFPERGNGQQGMKTYAKELANHMYFKFYDNVSTWQTEHGNLCEDSAFNHYQMYYDKSAIHHPPFAHVGDFGGQADCVSQTHGVDFKCPTTLKGWIDYIYDGIDKQQYHQAQMYMMLYNRDEWRIAAYLLETDRMSNNGEQYPIDENQRMIITTVQREEGWYDRLIESAKFVIGWRDFYYNELIKQFGTK